MTVYRDSKKQREQQYFDECKAAFRHVFQTRAGDVLFNGRWVKLSSICSKRAKITREAALAREQMHDLRMKYLNETESSVLDWNATEDLLSGIR